MLFLFYFYVVFINIPDAAEDAMETLSANQRSGHPGSIDWTIGRRSIESDQFKKFIFSFHLRFVNIVIFPIANFCNGYFESVWFTDKHEAEEGWEPD